VTETTDVNQRVREMLEGSRIAKAAAEIAAGDNNRGEMCRLRQKSRDLRKDAHDLDPEHRCPAWAGDRRGAAAT
jgi:hypothetical protein